MSPEDKIKTILDYIEKSAKELQNILKETDIHYALGIAADNMRVSATRARRYVQ